MHYLILLKPDLYKEGIQDHQLHADSMEQTDASINFYRHNFSGKELIAIYRVEHVIFAGEFATFKNAPKRYSPQKEKTNVR